MAGGHQLAVSWLLTVIFALLLVPCVQRVTRPEVPGAEPRRRDSDLAELLLTLAMVAMLSPVGGPIPAAGWQAVLLLVTVYFLRASLRERRAPRLPHERGEHGHVAHHAVCAALMLYMVAGMPHDDGVSHGPWFTMAGMDASAQLALPALAVAGALGLAADATVSGARLIRRRTGAPAWYASRETYRAVMGLGMAYMLVTAL